MLDLQIRRIADQSLVPVNLACLAMEVQGDFLFPGEQDGYAGGADPDLHTGPAVIVRCVDKQDVMRCLDFASAKGLLITMHNGPNGQTRWSDCDRGIAVDLSGLVRTAA